MNIRGNIVVKPHILKFICHIENLGIDQAGQPLRPLDVSKSGIVGHTLKLLLSYKFELDDNESEDISNKYSAVLPFVFPKRAWDRGKMYTSKNDAKVFNSHMHKLFHEFVLLQVIQYAEKGKLEKDAINDYLEIIGAEEDVYWESVKRVNLRLRNSKKLGTFHDKKVVAA